MSLPTRKKTARYSRIYPNLSADPYKDVYKRQVKDLTNLYLLKNSLSITLKTVYPGIAKIIPGIPARFPAISITKKISIG